MRGEARSLSCTNEYLATDRGGCVNEQTSRSNCSVASQRGRNGVGMDRSAKG